jgi:hypothetical protein
LGNLRFGVPEPFEPVIRGIAMHDSGWPMHDDAPTLNERGLPLHVFETPVEISTRIWTESVRLAAEQHDYSGLLVSLHVMALSRLAQSHISAPQHRIEHARELFELNKFQQNQIEVQETLRPRLGLRADLPLQYGLGCCLTTNSSRPWIGSASRCSAATSRSIPSTTSTRDRAKRRSRGG